MLKVSTTFPPVDSLTAFLYLVAQQPEVRYLKVDPDSIVINTNDTIQFDFEAYDQFHNAFTIMPEWSSSGGVTDNSGLFSSEEEGAFEVFLSDPGSGLKDTAYVTVITDQTVGLDDQSRFVTEKLHTVYPNPFSLSTTIKYELKERCFVDLRIYNASGQEVATLVNGDRNAGSYEVNWYAWGLMSGWYFSRIVINELAPFKKDQFTETRKLLLIK